MEELNPFTDIEYTLLQQAQSREADSIYGSIGNWRIDSRSLEAGEGQKEVGITSEAGNERIFVGSRANPLVLMGQLKDKTGVDEYGLWVKGAALYLGGYKQYDIIATKEGAGATTLVFYAGNEYTTIKAAIDQAQTDGKTDLTIFVRAGTYTENEYTTGWNMNVRLIGEDKDTSIILFGTSQKYWRFNKNLYFINLTVAGNSASNALIYVEGGDYVYGDNCKIINLYSHANGAGGIKIGACTDLADTGVIIKNCDISCPSALTDSPSGLYAGICISGDRGNIVLSGNNLIISGYGIWLAGTTNQIQNYIIQNRIGMILNSTLVRGSGIYVNSTYLAQTLIDGNGVFVASGTGTNYPYGIYLSGLGTTIQNNRVVNNFVVAANVGYEILSSGVVFNNNQAQGCISHGMVIRGYLPNSDNINNINGNTVYDCGGDGISLDGSNFTVTGNSIFNCAAGIGDAAASISQHYNIVCSANLIKSCDYGIRIKGAGTAVGTYSLVYSNNYISGNIDQTTGIGISIGTGFQNVVIEGNTIRYFDTGIGLDQDYGSDCGYIDIANNDIDDMNSHAINFSGYNVSPLKIVNNKVFDGILLESLGDGSVIDNNYIYGANGIVVNVNVVGAKIKGNHLDVSTNNGILITGNISGGSSIVDNWIDTQAAGAVALKIDGSMYDCIIDGNHIDSEIIGIRIGVDMDNSIFSNNWIQYDADGYGIQIIGDVDTSTANNEGSVFSGNRIQHDDTTGATECIYIGGAARNLTVTGNRLYGGAAGNYVIVIVGTTHYCLFTGNRNSEGLAAGSIGDGIQGTGARTGNVVSGNLMT